MNRQHTYEVDVTWTGNQGNGSSTYRGYARDYDIARKGNPVIVQGAAGESDMNPR